jgi:hypothetical protein
VRYPCSQQDRALPSASGELESRGTAGTARLYKASLWSEAIGIVLFEMFEWFHVPELLFAGMTRAEHVLQICKCAAIFLVTQDRQPA